MRLRATKLNAIGNRRRGAAGWTPAALGSALALWLDADDAVTITLNDSTVSQWNDKSGNNRDAVQAVAASQPAYTPAGLNGKAVLTFDGSNDLFELSSGILLDDNFTHVHSVLVRSTTGRNSVDVGRTTTPAGYGNWWFSDGVLYSLLRGTSFMAHGSSTATGTFINGLVRNNSGTQAYRNGTAFGVPQGAAATANVTLNAIGRAQGGSAALHNGIMAEVIVGRSDLSTADRQKLEGYLAWKWGLQLNLPIDHPYRWDGTLFGYYKFWTPADITTALWLDAADASTITLNGSTVSQWRDRSGNGRHVAQATAVKQPTYTLAAQNNLNVLSFDGNNRSLFASSGVINIPQPFSRFVAAQFLVKNNQSVLLDSDTLNTQCVFYNGETGTNWIVANGLVPDYMNYAYGTRDFLNHQHFHIVNGANSYWGIDGSSPTGPVNGGPGGQAGIRIGNIRTEFAPNYAFNGRVFEIVLVPYVIDTSDRQKLEGYLAWKWGTQSTLPADHPYKNGAPTV